MNEIQHKAVCDHSRALSQVNLKQHELSVALSAAGVTGAALVSAMKADPASWNGTPGIDRYAHLLAWQPVSG